MLVLSGCATPQGALQRTTSQSVHVEKTSPAKISAAISDVMTGLGYQPTGEGNSQTPGYRASHPDKLLRWVRGGSPMVSFILVPKAQGWDVVLFPEPDGLYPGPDAAFFKKALENIRLKASQTSH
jgi:hypothetical protein